VVIDRQGHEIARELVGYDAAEVCRVAGYRSDALSAVIHRNNMCCCGMIAETRPGAYCEMFLEMLEVFLIL